MICDLLGRVPLAGKSHSAVTAPSFSNFRHSFSSRPSPPFWLTVNPQPNRVLAWNYSTYSDGTVPAPVPIRPRVELKKYIKLDIYGVLLCSLLLLCINFIFSTSKLKYRKKLPPGPKGLPILGSLLTIGNRPHESLAKLSKTYGPIMTVKFGMVNIVIASSAEMAKEILLHNDRAFSGRPTPEAVAAEKNHETSMVWSSGESPHWKKLRKICTSQLFTNKKLDGLRDLRNQMMETMIEEVDRARKNREPVYMARLAFGVSLNFLSNTMFSSDSMFGAEKFNGSTDELKELIGSLIELVGTPNVADFLPLLKSLDPQGIRRRLVRSYEGLRGLLDGVIERRVKRRACESVRDDDFLDVLLDHNEENDGPQGLSYQNINVLLMAKRK